jgi:hypothetical protein
VNKKIHSTVGLFIPIGILIFLMYLSAIHHGPSGQTLGIFGFILFWLKEIIFLAFMLLAIVAILVAKVVERKRKNLELLESKQREVR